MENTQIFSIDLSKSDKNVWLTVFRNSLMCLFFSLESLWYRVNDREQHLLKKTNITEPMFYKDKLREIMIKFSNCRKLDDFKI